MDGLINIFLKGLSGKTTTLFLKEDSTIDDLFKEANSKTGIPMDEMRLLFAKYELRMGQGKTLKDFNMQNLSTVFMVLRLRGGWNPVEMLRLKKKSLTELRPFIKLTTTRPDMISFDDDPERPRAIMPCGHVIGPESMTSYCQSLLSTGQYTFLCPHVDDTTRQGCNREWEYFLVRHVACLSPDEQQWFETKIVENYLNKKSGIRQCPGCSSYCERRDQNKPRVICPVCTKSKKRNYEFCWHCLHEWAGSDDLDCGNLDCNGVDRRLMHLSKCDTKTIVGVAGCPSVRACPKCGILIEHVSDCKHMNCKACRAQFCFICLKQASKGSYQCGSYNTKCTPAPVQVKLPGA